MALFDIFYSILFHFTPDYLILKKKKILVTTCSFDFTALRDVLHGLQKADSEVCLYPRELHLGSVREAGGLGRRRSEEQDPAFASDLLVLPFPISR